MKRGIEGGTVWLIVTLVIGLIVFVTFATTYLLTANPYAAISKQSSQTGEQSLSVIEKLQSLVFNKKAVESSEVVFDPYGREYKGNLVETIPYIIDFSSTTTKFAYSGFASCPGHFHTIANFENLIQSKLIKTVTSDFSIPEGSTLTFVNKDGDTINAKLVVKYQSNPSPAYLFLVKIGGTQYNLAIATKNGGKLEEVKSEVVLDFKSCMDLFLQGKTSDNNYFLVYKDGSKLVQIHLSPNEELNYVLAGFICEVAFESKVNLVFDKIALKVSPTSTDDRGQCVIHWELSENGGNPVAIGYNFPSSRYYCAKLYDNINKWLSECISAEAKSSKKVSIVNRYFHFIGLGKGESLSEPYELVLRGYLLKYPNDFYWLSPITCNTKYLVSCPDKVVSAGEGMKNINYNAVIVCWNYITFAHAKQSGSALEIPPNVLVKDPFTLNPTSINKVCVIQQKDELKGSIGGDTMELSRLHLTLKKMTEKLSFSILSLANSAGTVLYLNYQPGLVLCSLKIKTAFVNYKLLFLTKPNICKALGGELAKVPLNYVLFNGCLLYKVRVGNTPYLIVSAAEVPDELSSSVITGFDGTQGIVVNIPGNGDNLMPSRNIILINAPCSTLDVIYDVQSAHQAYCCVTVSNNGRQFSLEFEGGKVFPSECGNGIWLESSCSSYVG